MNPYCLEIYPPGNPGLDVACTIEADMPFLAIQRGDLINPRLWSEHYHGMLKETLRSEGRWPKHGVVLRVTGVEHMIVQRDDRLVQHKLAVFTEAVEDVAESRP